MTTQQTTTNANFDTQGGSTYSGQNFTAKDSNIYIITLRFSKTGTPPDSNIIFYNVNQSTGLPTTEILRIPVLASNISTSLTDYNFLINQGVTIGTRYAIRLGNAVIGDANNHYTFSGSITNTYSDGNRFTSGAVQNNDLYFKIYSPVTSTCTATSYRINSSGTFSDYSSPFSLNYDSNFKIDYNSTDSIPSTESTKTTYCAVDLTPPIVSISGNTYATWTNTNQTITLTASDNNSGIALTQYKIDGGAWQTYSGAFTISTDGNHQIDYNTLDGAGNTSGIQTSYSAVDKTNPAISISGNTYATWTNTNQTITLTATDSLSGIALTQYRVDSGAWNNYTNSFTISTDLNHQIDFNTKDNAGNTSGIQTSYSAVDKTNPTIGTTTISGFITYSAYITGTGNAYATITDTTSGVNTTQCEYTTDNGSNWLPADGNTTHCYKTGITITNGTTYKFNLRGKDNAGNQGTGTAVATTYTGDTIAPITTMGYSTPASDTNSTTVTLTCTDSGSGCASTKYRIDSGAWQTYTVPFTYANVGRHTIDFNSTDNIGNIEATNTSYLNMPIKLTIFYPKNVATLVQLSEKWILRSTGGIVVNLTDLTTDKNLYVLPNILTTFYIADVNGNYVQNTYTRTYYADSNTGYDTLQPYLYAISTSLATTINVLNKNNLSAIPNITIKIYGNLPGIGYTLIGQGTTDSKGQMLQLFIAGQNYTFDVYNGSTFLQTYNYTALNSQAYIYFNYLNIDVNSYTPVTPSTNTDMNTVIADFYSMRNILFNTCTSQNPCFPSALIAIVLTLIALVTATSITSTSGAFIGIKGLSIIAFCSFTIFFGIGWLPVFIYAFLGAITLLMAVLIQ